MWLLYLYLIDAQRAGIELNIFPAHPSSRGSGQWGGLYASCMLDAEHGFRFLLSARVFLSEDSARHMYSEYMIFTWRRYSMYQIKHALDLKLILTLLMLSRAIVTLCMIQVSLCCRVNLLCLQENDISSTQTLYWCFWIHLSIYPAFGPVDAPVLQGAKSRARVATTRCLIPLWWPPRYWLRTEVFPRMEGARRFPANFR